VRQNEAVMQTLQSLIEKLQREAVEEGQRQAQAITAEAQAKAIKTVKEAEAKAARILEQAEQDAKAFTERSTRALEQAGRDLLISVSQGVESILAGLVRESLQQALTPEVLREILLKMTEAYLVRGGRERRMTVLLSPEDHEQLVKYYAELYRQKLAQGVELKLDNEVVRGFRVAMDEGYIEHDFTLSAIAEALTYYLQPHLARIIPRTAPKLSQEG